MANKKQQEEKHLKLLRQMLTLADNKKCMDCKEKGPFYACTTFGTFVCPTCSGIHREFGHRVKSISMATFTPEEVKFLQEMGNGRASDIWLANWAPSDYPEPDAGDKEKIKEFMHKKYVQKVWYRKPGSEEPSRKVSRERPQSRGRGSEPPRTEPLESILGKDIPPIQITHNIHVNVPNMPQKKEKATKKPDLLWEEPVPVIPPHQSAHHSPISAPPPVTTPAPQTSNSSVLPGLESLFTAPIHEAPRSQTPSWPPVVPQQSAPLAGPMPQITTEMFQQMNPQQQQHYLAMQQQWLQQQQLLLQQRMTSVSLGQPAPYSAPINPFAVPQVPQVYGVPPGYPTAPIPTTHTPVPSHTTSAPLLPAQPKEVKKPEPSNSLLFADLSPLAGAKSSTPSTPAPTLSASRPGPMEFGTLQGAPPLTPSSTQAPTPYNPFGF